MTCVHPKGIQGELSESIKVGLGVGRLVPM